jgi:hypothetical protein
VLLALVVAVSSFIVEAAPAEIVPERPAPLRPATTRAAFCADTPSFSGHLTSSSGSTSVLTESTTGNVYGYISNVVDDWSCTAYPATTASPGTATVLKATLPGVCSSIPRPPATGSSARPTI